MTQTTKNAQQIVNSLTYSEVDAALQPDTRRMMRNERFSLQAAIQSGDAGKINAAKAEALRVAGMWGVAL